MKKQLETTKEWSRWIHKPQALLTKSKKQGLNWRNQSAKTIISCWKLLTKLTKMKSRRHIGKQLWNGIPTSIKTMMKKERYMQIRCLKILVKHMKFLVILVSEISMIKEPMLKKLIREAAWAVEVSMAILTKYSKCSLAVEWVVVEATPLNMVAEAEVVIVMGSHSE